MRNRTALDAVARWLVLTLAGVGLFALMPATSFAAPGFAATRWLSMQPVQLLALAMVVLAWILLVVHLAQLRGPWLRDVTSWTLALLSVVAAGACVAAFGWGTTASTAGSFVVAVVVQVVLGLRIDGLARRPEKQTAAVTAA